MIITFIYKKKVTVDVTMFFFIISFKSLQLTDQVSVD